MPTTSNFGWTTPADTDLVKDGAAAIRTLGNGIDTSFLDLKGGTTGQNLRKASNTDLDFTFAGDATNTVIDAEGDLLVGDSADTLQRLAIGTTGQVLTVDTTLDGKIKWAAAAGGGKVLQVVQATHSTEVSSSSTTYAATGLTVSITPSSATSKIYVHAIINGLTKSTGNANNASNIRLLRNASTTIITSTGINYTGVDAANQGQGVIQYLDSPATTSATTYDVYFANRVASAIVYAQDGGANNVSVITAWEIGA